MTLGNDYGFGIIANSEGYSQPGFIKVATTGLHILTTVTYLPSTSATVSLLLITVRLTTATHCPSPLTYRTLKTSVPVTELGYSVESAKMDSV